LKKKQREQKYENNRIIMASFGVNQFFGQWITGPFGLFVFFFFKQEIGLNVYFAMTAMVIYSVWNAINDPLIGYLVEKIKMPWERKYGMKRFPWVIIGGIP
jgi:GPH family glycoside/pentoside/hexuronide:cation symporter